MISLNLNVINWQAEEGQERSIRQVISSVWMKNARQRATGLPFPSGYTTRTREWNQGKSVAGTVVLWDHIRSLCCSSDQTKLLRRKSYSKIKATLSGAGRGEHCSGGFLCINHAKTVNSLETGFLGEKEVTNKKEEGLLEEAKRFCKFLASLFFCQICPFPIKKKTTKQHLEKEPNPQPGTNIHPD